MNPLAEQDVMAVARPNLIRQAATDNASTLGFKIDQSKTWAKFSAPFQQIVVGFLNMNMLPNAFQYPDSEHFIITAIRIYQGTNATLNQTAWTPGVAAGDAQNGNFNITNSGTIVMKDMPFTMFSQGTNNADGGYLVLSKPIVWLAQTQLQMACTWPVILSTATLNLRVEFIGLKLI
jgi:hypothetical protein